MPTSEEILQQRNAIRNQLNEVNTPVTQGDAMRYLSERVDNFKPLFQEQQNFSAQANNLLPDQIQQYTASRQANPGGTASPLAMLNNIIQQQGRMRGTSDLIGNIANQANARLGNISQDALGFLSQRQKQLGQQFDSYNQEQKLEELPQLKQLPMGVQMITYHVY
jgi:hypothetical protein